MNNSKIDQLLEFLKEEPKDTFTLYALALEYEKLGDKKALDYYNLLLSEYPTYLATYYHAAKYIEAIDLERAKSIYAAGITLAKTQQKTKAYQELSNALNMLLQEEE